MRNVTWEVQKGGKLVITADLNGDAVPSSSGATQVIATANHEQVSGPNLPSKLAGKTVKFGLNVFFK